ncbi:MAG: hypothetical protein ACI4V2_01465 [Alloprevotella sp.]
MYYHTSTYGDPDAAITLNPEPVSRNVTYSCFLTRTTPVETTDYIPADTTAQMPFAICPQDDFTDTDWLDEYHERNLTPTQLIAKLGQIANLLADGIHPGKPSSYWKRLARECKGWTISDEEAYTDD